MLDPGNHVSWSIETQLTVQVSRYQSLALGAWHSLAHALAQAKE